MTGGFDRVLSGNSGVSKLLMICVVPGVVLAAAYMLRMLQKVVYGGTHNPDHSKVSDLGLREVATLLPLVCFVFWIGLHPEPFTRVLHTSVQHVLELNGKNSEVTSPKYPAGVARTKMLASVPGKEDAWKTTEHTEYTEKKLFSSVYSVYSAVSQSKGAAAKATPRAEGLTLQPFNAATLQRPQ
jgi:NADH:ubiquinone oxidoreductase subunit 5 (subunit L)/multisubunit Na+/H+ antiporter MnhA subunit